jgi:hypothetical protein
VLLDSGPYLSASRLTEYEVSGFVANGVARIDAQFIKTSSNDPGKAIRFLAVSCMLSLEAEVHYLANACCIESSSSLHSGKLSIGSMPRGGRQTGSDHCGTVGLKVLPKIAPGLSFPLLSS